MLPMFKVFSQSFATLSLLGLVAAAVGVALLLARRRSIVEREVGSLLPALVFVVSLGATLGSLFYSELMHFEPCRLCWFQRIAMYPLAFLSGLALWRRDRTIMWYIRLQAIVGAAIGAYHYLVQTLDILDGGSCSATVPCTLRYVNEYGFVSIPFMAMCCFLLIAVAAHYIVRAQGEHSE